MKKTFLIAAAALMISACGFTPMHEPGLGLGSSTMKSIDVNLIETGNVEDQEGGFWVQQHLHDRLGDNPAGAHILEITPKVRRAGLSISSDDVARRYDLTISAAYKLIDRKTGDVLETGSVDSVSTFGSPTDPYGEISAGKTTLQNVARDVSDRLIIELATHFAEDRS